MAWDVVVIGAGAAGLLAAARAAERGRRVLLLEKNRKPGVKILMSGGTRCNLTHAAQARDIVRAFGQQGSFLHSALATLGPRDVVELFEAEGVLTKVEPGGKVFPASDKALDVLAALVRRLQRSGAVLALDEPVRDLAAEPSSPFQVCTSRRTVSCDRVLLTTGGQSYPGCGTAGDGYVWARRLGHTIVPPCPALVPVTIRADWAKALRGITIPDVVVSVKCVEPEPIGGKQRRETMQQRGSFLFAHFGLSGPAVLDVSRFVARHEKPRSLVLQCDFLPDVSSEQLNHRYQESAQHAGRKHVAALLAEDLPRRLVEALMVQSQVPLERTAAELNRAERAKMTEALKATRFPLTGTLGFEKAEVTAGGIARDEVDSHTMQSKIVPRLYLAGEVLDLDGPIGGYNFQAAFSTGWLAGENV